MSDTTHSSRHAATAVNAARKASPAPPGRCRLDVGRATSAGLERERNEDSFYTQHLAWCNRDRPHELAVFVVADGMGGHEAGDEASGLTIGAVAAALNPLVYNIACGRFPELPDSALVRWVEDALKEANQVVHEQADGQPPERAMAATATVAFIWNDRVVVGHVGDCRLYHYRSGKLVQVTHDHTTVARLVAQRRIKPEEARHHPRAGEVTQAVGGSDAVQPSTYQFAVEPGDWLLLACDGFHNQVEEREVVELLKRGPVSALELARELVRRADRAGGSDNCTVVAVRCA